MSIPLITRGRYGIQCCKCSPGPAHMKILCNKHAHVFTNSSEDVKMAVEDTVEAFNNGYLQNIKEFEAKISKIFNGPPLPSRLDEITKKLEMEEERRSSDMTEMKKMVEERARQFEDIANSLIEEQAKINKKTESRLKRLEAFMEEQKTVQWKEQMQAHLENKVELQYYIDNPGAVYGSYRIGVLSLI